MVGTQRLPQSVRRPVLLSVAKEQDEFVGRKGAEIANGEDAREALAEGTQLVGDASEQSVVDDEADVLLNVALVDRDVFAASLELDEGVAG